MVLSTAGLGRRLLSEPGKLGFQRIVAVVLCGIPRREFLRTGEVVRVDRGGLPHPSSDRPLLLGRRQGAGDTFLEQRYVEIGVADAWRVEIVSISALRIASVTSE